MKMKYITEPLERFTVKRKSPDSNYTLTDYVCPFCKEQVSKRNFEQHVFSQHGRRSDECFAMLFGVPFPARCACGKELHYSSARKGFPTTCGDCATGSTAQAKYQSAGDAHKAVEQLAQMLANAKAEEIRLKKEEELSRVPLEQLGFPSSRYNPFMRRLSMAIRTHAINGEKDALIKLANLIDGKLEAQDA